MTSVHALLRCGFPYVKTLGMRRVTSGPVDVAPGPDDLVYILTRANPGVGGNCIRIVNWSDEDLGTIGGGGTGDGNFQWPTGLVMDKDHNLIVSDEGLNRITIMGRDGGFIAKWGEFGCEPGQINRPSSIALDKDDNLLLVDSFNHRVQKFTKNGEYISSWGGYGSEDGQFDLPWGIAIRDDGNIFVSDWRNNRVQQFTSDGIFINHFGSSQGEISSLNRPAGVAVDEDGDVYVADRDNHRIAIYDQHGRYVQQLVGDSLLMGMARDYVRANPVVLRLREMTQLDNQKLLRFPNSVTLAKGMLWIGDFGSDRVQVYRKDSERLEAHEMEPPRNSPKLIIN